MEIRERKDRRHKCKCGKFFYWSVYQNTVICPHCNTVYNIDSDYQQIWWLEEKITEIKKPFRTYPTVIIYSGKDLKGEIWQREDLYQKLYTKETPVI